MSIRFRIRARWNNPEEALPKTLPRDILDRVGRVLEYHQSTKQTYEQIHQHPVVPDWENRPSPFRIFTHQPRVELPTRVLDIPAPALHVLNEGIAALPDSQLHPPQDLKTLAGWLYFADGIIEERKAGNVRYWLRTVPSSGSLFPQEIYVAAFGIEGLEPGLYHYSPRGFHLRKLRDGPTALSLMKRGRPDLEFLKTVPAVLLISTVFCRSSWLFRQRAYRTCLIDAGNQLQNLVSVGLGLGIPTSIRLKVNDRSFAELIGTSEDAPFAEAEAVQAMVVWADEAQRPMAVPRNGGIVGGELPSIAREPLAQRVIPYGSILAAHEDCVAPGVAIRDVRPPWTEMLPVSADRDITPLPEPERFVGGPSLRHVLETRRNAGDFQLTSIPRDAFWQMNRIAFRSGSYWPIFSSGPHVGLVRPIWVVHDVAGMNAGVWSYDPITDCWFQLRYGDYRTEAQALCLDQPAGGSASAVCFLLADLHSLMKNAGPDLYRMAHLEAGAIAQRLHLAAAGFGVGSAGLGNFYEDDIRTFLALDNPGWEPLYTVAVGVPLT